MGSNELNVYEGGTVLISPTHIFVQTEYYKSRITEYHLIKLPKHGCVQVRKSCTKLNKFLYEEFNAGIVHYWHDGSENLKDSVVLVALAGSKRSFPITLSIIILPINDQIPHVINNTGLTMWEGGVTILTNSMIGE